MGLSLERVQRRVRRDPWLFAVIGVGLAVRAVLIPITHGQDFVVWDKASAATLRGVNIYAHHPHYAGGPYAYFPLFVYIELPFQWLAQHTALSFTVLGKLPIVGADVACALLITEELRHNGRSRRASAVAAAFFFLNPLVLYDSAYYGRFDTVACALLLLAIRGFTREAAVSGRTAVYYALSVASKTFPAFVLAGVVRCARGAWRRVVVVLVVVVVGMSVPYLTTSRAFVHDIFFYDAGKPPAGLSWQHLLLKVTDDHAAKLVSYALLAFFVLSTMWLSRIQDLRLYTALTLVLFLVCSKVVREQYLIWPMPWLVFLGWDRLSGMARASLVLLGSFTVVGLIDNESFHPFGRSSSLLDLLLATACVSYVMLGVSDAESVRNSDRPLPVAR